MCIVKLGSFHGCFFCKVNQRGCSLCPKVDGSSDSPLNVPHKNWCWYITLVHHIASILEMDTLEGPIAVLPSYEGVQFPSFNRKLLQLVKTFKTTMTDDDCKAKWKQLQQEPPTPYYGVPHRKLIELGTNRPERGRFPIIGHGAKVERQLYSILNRAKEGSLSRLWAVGYDDSRPRPSQAKASADGIAQGSLKTRTLIKGWSFRHLHFRSSYSPPTFEQMLVKRSS